jgi:hypothetical protein
MTLAELLTALGSSEDSRPTSLEIHAARGERGPVTAVATEHICEFLGAKLSVAHTRKVPVISTDILRGFPRSLHSRGRSRPGVCWQPRHMDAFWPRVLPLEPCLVQHLRKLVTPRTGHADSPRCWHGSLLFVHCPNCLLVRANGLRNELRVFFCFQDVPADVSGSGTIGHVNDRFIREHENILTLNRPVGM